MKKYRIIFHIDLNAFFASCEAAEDPSLREKPIGIGPKSERGILTTANYEARKYGVKSAMPVSEARRLCPKLRILPVNFPLYEKYSRLFFEYLSSYTDMLEPASIDEGYLDMTDALAGRHPHSVAKKMQKDLQKEHALPVSIGIAPNMFLAKMASDMKKPLGITILRKRDVEKKLWPLPIERLHGIGKKTVPDLRLIGIETIGNLANFSDKEKLRAFLGSQTDAFIAKAKGHDERRVDPDRRNKHQSLGNSKTYDGFLHEHAEILGELERLTAKVSDRLQEENLAAKTFAVQIRYNDYENRSKHITLPHHTNDFSTMFTEAERLFDELYEDRPVHLVGVSASNIIKGERLFRQLSIFEIEADKKSDRAIDRVLESINRHYEKPLLQKGLTDKGENR